MATYIDFDGMRKEYSAEEEAAFLATLPSAPPQPVPKSISDRQFFQQLAMMALVTEQEAEAAVSAGMLPAAMSAFIDQLPTEEQFPARMKLKGATTFLRSDPLVETFAGMQGMSSEQIDDLWREAALL